MLILGYRDRHRAGRMRHRRPRGRARARRSRPRGRRHAEIARRRPSSSSCRQARDRLAEIGCVAVDIGPGLFTGLRVGVATAKALAHALRVPMIGVSSLDLLAFPLRFTRPAIVAGDRRPARARSSTRSTGRCPAACSGSPSPQVGTPDDLAAELLAHGEERLLRRRRRAALPRRSLEACARSSSPSSGSAYPSAALARAAGPRPGPARGVGQPLGARAALPAQARRRDQLVDEDRRRDGTRSTRHRSMRAPRLRRSPGSSPSCPMRRRHSAAVLRIEEQVYPRPWSPGLFTGELALRDEPVYSWRTDRRARRRLRRPDGTGDDGHVTNHRRRPGRGSGTGSATRLLLALAAAAIGRGATSLTLEVRVSNEAAQALYRRFGFAPAGIRTRLLRGHNEDALVMWAHDVDAPTRTPSAWRRIEARASPGSHDRGRVRASDMSEPTVHRCDRSVASDRIRASWASRRRVTRRPPPCVARRPTTCCRRSCRARSTCTLASAASCPRSPAEPTSSCSPRSIAQALVEAGVDGRRHRRRRRHRSGPGLVGALLVGVSARPRRSRWSWDVPFVGVNHLEAHLYAALLEEPDLELPLVVLLVSGRAHAARRAWRTTAATGCSARPSTTPRARRSTRWPASSASAIRADRPSTGWRWRATRGHPFPRAMLDDGLDFSFSGLKTAVVNHVRKHPDVAHRRRGGLVPGGGGRRARDQGAAARPARSAPRRLCLGGGVAANSLLRERFLDACVEDGMHGFLPSRAMCTDNAAMVAAAGWWRLRSPTARRPSTPAPTRTCACP